MEIVKLHLEKSIEYWAREKNKKLLVDGMPFISGTSFHAVDLDPVCQETITSQPFPPLHVFSDMVLLLVPSARVAVLKTMEQHRDAIQADLATCSSRTAAQDDKDGAKVAIREKGEHVLESLLQVMDQFDPLFVEVADCAKHDGAKCDVLPAQADLDAALSFMMAGTSCVDWSSMGGSLTLAGWTVLPFAIQLKLVQRIRPTVFFHENTRNFKPELLARHLPGYNIHHGIQNPQMRGFPVRRARIYTAVVRSDFELDVPLEEIAKLNRHPNFDGGSLFCAPDDLVTWMNPVQNSLLHSCA